MKRFLYEVREVVRFNVFFYGLVAIISFLLNESSISQKNKEKSTTMPLTQVPIELNHRLSRVYRGWCLYIYFQHGKFYHRSLSMTRFEQCEHVYACLPFALSTTLFTYFEQNNLGAWCVWVFLCQILIYCWMLLILLKLHTQTIWPLKTVNKVCLCNWLLVIGEVNSTECT